MVSDHACLFVSMSFFVFDNYFAVPLLVSLFTDVTKATTKDMVSTRMMKLNLCATRGGGPKLTYNFHRARSKFSRITMTQSSQLEYLI